jgi:hypothetical protein
VQSTLQSPAAADTSHSYATDKLGHASATTYCAASHNTCANSKLTASYSSTAAVAVKLIVRRAVVCAVLSAVEWQRSFWPAAL